MLGENKQKMPSLTFAPPSVPTEADSTIPTKRPERERHQCPSPDETTDIDIDLDLDTQKENINQSNKTFTHTDASNLPSHIISRKDVSHALAAVTPAASIAQDPLERDLCCYEDDLTFVVSSQQGSPSHDDRIIKSGVNSPDHRIYSQHGTPVHSHYQQPYTPAMPLPPPPVNSDMTIGFNGRNSSLMPRFLCHEALYDFVPPGQSKLLDLRFEDWRTMVNREDEFLSIITPAAISHKIDTRMRGILIEWFTQVCEEQEWSRKAFHLSCSILDRFLVVTQREVDFQNFQTIGAAVLCLAAKFEGHDPSINVLARACIDPPGDTQEEQQQFYENFAINVKEIQDYEFAIFKDLDGVVDIPTLYDFMVTYLQNASLVDPETYGSESANSNEYRPIHLQRFNDDVFLRNMNRLDAVVMDYEIYKYPYSALAAAAFAVSEILEDDDEVLKRLTGYSLDDLADVVKFVSSKFDNSIPFCNWDVDKQVYLQRVHPSLLTVLEQQWEAWGNEFGECEYDVSLSPEREEGVVDNGLQVY